MRKIDYKEGRELEKTHVCKECGGGLVTAWLRAHPDIPSLWNVCAYYIKCSENQAHTDETKKRWAKEQPTYIKEQNGNRTNDTKGN